MTPTPQVWHTVKPGDRERIRCTANCGGGAENCGLPAVAYLSSRYSHGACANETCSLKARLTFVAGVKGDRDYWIGAACAIPPLAN